MFRMPKCDKKKKKELRVCSGCQNAIKKRNYGYVWDTKMLFKKKGTVGMFGMPKCDKGTTGMFVTLKCDKKELRVCLGHENSIKKEL